jgi:hypothetical protein
MNSHLQKDPEANYSQNCQEYINYMNKLVKDYPILPATREPKPEQPAVEQVKPAAGLTSLTAATTTTSGSGSSQSGSLASKSSLNPAASPFVPPAPVSMFPPLTTSSGLGAPAFGSAFLTPAAPGPSSLIGASASSVSKDETGDDEDYVPPKNEDINTEEEDSVFSKRLVVV